MTIRHRREACKDIHIHKRHICSLGLHHPPLYIKYLPQRVKMASVWDLALLSCNTNKFPSDPPHLPTNFLISRNILCSKTIYREHFGSLPVPFLEIIIQHSMIKMIYHSFHMACVIPNPIWLLYKHVRKLISRLARLWSEQSKLYIFTAILYTIS